MVVVMVEGVEVLGGYCPPAVEDKAAMAEMTHEVMLERDFFHKNNVQPKWWLMLGDFNDEARDSPTAEVGKSASGVVVAKETDQHDEDEEPLKKGSRWDSESEIDWLMSSKPDRCQNLRYSEVVVADHKVLEFELATDTLSDFSTGMLQKKPTYPKPGAVENIVWAEHLSNVWREQAESETRQALQKSMRSETVTVSEEWTCF